MTKQMQRAAQAVRGAYRASVQLQDALKALGAKAAHSDALRLQAAKLVADDANNYYKLKGDKCMVAYKGQRDIAFGIKTGEKDDGSPIFERTKECNAVRMWFARNVMGKKHKAKKAKPSIWSKVTDSINDVAKKLDREDAAAFKAELKKLIAKYRSK